MTALDLEFGAILSHLRNAYEVVHPAGTVYNLGEFVGGGQVWDVAVAEIGTGNPIAGIETIRALDYFRPHVALFVGVAGGIKDVRLGDVVAADYVYGYESSKAEEQLLPRIKTFGSAYPLVQCARAIRRSDRWHLRIRSGAKPAGFVGPIASGEQVLTRQDAEIVRLLRAHCGDALAVEMEGWGFLFAAHTNEDVPAIVIRGISDLLDDKDPLTDWKTQPAAAEHAAAFAFELLASFGSPRNIDAVEAVAELRRWATAGL
jgi:nucleoside phosphorylase